MSEDKELREILIEVGRSYGACHMQELNDKVINKAITAILSAGWAKKDSIELDEEKMKKIYRDWTGRKDYGFIHAIAQAKDIIK